MFSTEGCSVFDHWARSTSKMFSTEGWCMTTEREARAQCLVLGVVLFDDWARSTSTMFSTEGCSMFDHWARSTSTMFSTEGWCLTTLEARGRVNETRANMYVTRSTNGKKLSCNRASFIFQCVLNMACLSTAFYDVLHVLGQKHTRKRKTVPLTYIADKHTLCMDVHETCMITYQFGENIITNALVKERDNRSSSRNYHLKFYL